MHGRSWLGMRVLNSEWLTVCACCHMSACSLPDDGGGNLLI